MAVGGELERLRVEHVGVDHAQRAVRLLGARVPDAAGRRVGADQVEAAQRSERVVLPELRSRLEVAAGRRHVLQLANRRHLEDGKGRVDVDPSQRGKRQGTDAAVGADLMETGPVAAARRRGRERAAPARRARARARLRAPPARAVWPCSEALRLAAHTATRPHRGRRSCPPARAPPAPLLERRTPSPAGSARPPHRRPRGSSWCARRRRAPSLTAASRARLLATRTDESPRGETSWARLGSNQRPLACEAIRLRLQLPLVCRGNAGTAWPVRVPLITSICWEFSAFRARESPLWPKRSSTELLEPGSERDATQCCLHGRATL